MGTPKWTKHQERAIDQRRGDLIISAAAGSGKTTVLCERVIRSILDEKDPISISEMLIVTFTEASAAELKDKIAKKIREKIAEDPSSARLVRQLMLLQNADIGTIHSFCNKVVTQNTALLSLPSEVHIADESESDAIAANAMDRAISESYATDTDFPMLVNTFVSTSDKKLSEKLSGIYKNTQSHPRGIKIIRDLADEYADMSQNGWSESRFADLLRRHFISETGTDIAMLEEAVNYIRNDDKVYAKRGEMYEYDLEYMRRIVDGANAGWEQFMAALEIPYDSPGQKGNVTGEVDSKIVEAKETRDAIAKKIKEYKTKYYATPNEMRKGLERNSKFFTVLYNFFERFEKYFSEEKIRLALVDFTDLERMTYKLIVGKDGEPTELACEIAKKYRAIYIDEYQDTNAVQDGIFKAVSRNNRFMVGDIKQSIYRFRGAEPGIFASYRDTFEDLKKEDVNTNDDPHKIFLSDNFRCDKPIVEFSNKIFEVLFRNNSGKIAYLDDDALKFSKDEEPRDDYEKVSIILSEKDGDCPFYSEAASVALEVKKLLKSGVQPKDIAVIIRSKKNILKVFKKVFSSEGIPVDDSESSGTFDSPEILFLLSLLNCIDNPHRDIWLAGALSAGVFGIEFNDIVDIASEKYETQLSLYDKLRAYTEKNDFSKGRHFIKWIEETREKARSAKVSEIVDGVCNDFALSAMMLRDKEKAERTGKYINSLRDLARNYEKNAFRGLHSFMRLIENIRSGEKDENLGKTAEVGNSNFVRFISAHKSKGLEFEYCFISGCAKNMNMTDLNGNFLFSGSFGASATVVGLGGKVRYTTPLHTAVRGNMLDDQIDEEMRILYVALTRAKKKLYVTAELKDVKKALDKAEKMREFRAPYVFRKNSQYIMWILSTYDQGSSDVELIQSSVTPYSMWKEGALIEALGEKAVTFADDEREDSSDDVKSECGEKLLDLCEIRRRLEYRYPYSVEATLPSKLAVSKLFPSVLDADAVELVRQQERFTDRPKFISANGKGDITGAMRGTATHVFMQFCDFENAEKNGVETELARLVDKRFMDKAMAELVYIDKLKKFFSSELYAEIKSAKTVWREKRFNIMLPASEFTEKEELKKELSDAKLLVQGVFDCMIERSDNTLKLVDYKTDAVSGDVEADEQMFRDRYTTQLSYYTRACEMMMGKEIKEASVYSFGLGREVKII